jgi:hypothetical protein
LVSGNLYRAGRILRPACCLMALSSLGHLAAQVQTEADKQPRAEERAQDEEYDSQSAMVYFSHWLTMPPLTDFPPVQRPAVSPTPRQLKVSALFKGFFLKSHPRLYFPPRSMSSFAPIKRSPLA